MSTNKGTVKFFNEKKGFGFLTNENGKDVFVHANNLTDNITDGDTVYYDVEDTPKGVEHRPSAEEETWILLFEPVNTKHTGETISDITKESYPKI